MQGKMNLRLLLLLLVLGTLYSCSRQPANKERVNYFSLKKYMGRQLDSLRDLPVTFQKIIMLNGKADTLFSKDTSALKIYFLPFMNADIDKPALAGTYRIDNTTDEVTGTLTLLYTSTGKNTQPYQVQLQLDRQHNVKTVNVTSYSHNLIYDIHKNLFYEAGKMIQITTDEKLILVPEKKLNVKILLHPAATQL